MLVDLVFSTVSANELLWNRQTQTLCVSFKMMERKRKQRHCFFELVCFKCNPKLLIRLHSLGSSVLSIGIPFFQFVTIHFLLVRGIIPMKIDNIRQQQPRNLSIYPRELQKNSIRNLSRYVKSSKVYGIFFLTDPNLKTQDISQLMRTNSLNVFKFRHCLLPRMSTLTRALLKGHAATFHARLLDTYTNEVDIVVSSNFIWQKFFFQA